jgi:hypothetical protein
MRRASMIHALEMAKPNCYAYSGKFVQIKTLAQAKRHTGGGLQIVSKMPGYAYAIPARNCKVGAKLRKIAGSTCASCYAFEGFYKVYATSIDRAQAARLESLKDALWVESMAFLINHYCRDGEAKTLRGSFFRWHHSGDIQSIDHLRDIVAVVAATPNVTHWLPTREYAIVAKYRAIYGDPPANLVIRLSAHMVDGDAPSGFGLPTSTVTTNHDATCPAPTQGNACGDCRACWSPDVADVSYGLH